MIHLDRLTCLKNNFIEGKTLRLIYKIIKYKTRKKCHIKSKYQMKIRKT